MRLFLILVRFFRGLALCFLFILYVPSALSGPASIDVDLLKERLTPNASSIQVLACEISNVETSPCDRQIHFQTRGLGIFYGVSDFQGFIVTSKLAENEYEAKVNDWGWRSEKPEDLEGKVTPSISCATTKLSLEENEGTVLLSLKSRCRGLLWGNDHYFKFKVTDFNTAKNTVSGTYEIIVSDKLIGQAKGVARLILPRQSPSENEESDSTSKALLARTEQEDRVKLELELTAQKEREARLKAEMELTSQKEREARLKAKLDLAKIKSQQLLADAYTDQSVTNRSNSSPKPEGVKEALKTGQRFAIVIGNDDYKNVPKLENAVGDAKAISGLLSSLGYQVLTFNNLNEKEFKGALRQFKQRLQGGEEVVFFFAGHGVQIGSANYLLPTDVGSDSEDQIQDEGIPLQRVLDDFSESKVKFSLAMVDACRDNPFKSTGRSIGGRGLAATSAATGQMVIFSAGVGQQALDRLGTNDKARNGLFTRVLIDKVSQSKEPIHILMRDVRAEVAKLAQSVGHDQVPAIYDQVIGDFYFVPKK